MQSKRGRPSVDELMTPRPITAYERQRPPPELAGEEAEAFLSFVNAELAGLVHVGDGSAFGAVGAAYRAGPAHRRDNRANGRTERYRAWVLRRVAEAAARREPSHRHAGDEATADAAVAPDRSRQRSTA